MSHFCISVTRQHDQHMEKAPVVAVSPLTTQSAGIDETPTTQISDHPTDLHKSPPRFLPRQRPFANHLLTLQLLRLQLFQFHLPYLHQQFHLRCLHHYKVLHITKYRLCINKLRWKPLCGVGDKSSNKKWVPKYDSIMACLYTTG